MASIIQVLEEKLLEEFNEVKRFLFRMTDTVMDDLWQYVRQEILASGSAQKQRQQNGQEQLAEAATEPSLLDVRTNSPRQTAPNISRVNYMGMFESRSHVHKRKGNSTAADETTKKSRAK